MWVLWHGGHSYSPGYVEDMEEVKYFSEAKQICEDRYWNRDGQTPGVDETSGMMVWLSDERPDSTESPDRLIVRTKRGNWKVI